MTALAKKLDHQVTSHRVPREGMAAIEAGKFDALIVDILMPEIDGLDVIRTVRSRNPDMLIVAMSGGGKSFSATLGLRASEALGADSVLYKPFRLESLRTALATAPGHNRPDAPSDSPSNDAA